MKRVCGVVMLLAAALIGFGGTAVAGDMCGRLPAATVVDQVMASIAAASGSTAAALPAATNPGKASSASSAAPVAKSEPRG